MNQVHKFLTILFGSVVLSWDACAAVPARELAEIYGTVVEQLISNDDTYGGNLHPQKVFIELELHGDCPFPAPVDWSTVKTDAPDADLPAIEPPIACDDKVVGELTPEIQREIRARFLSKKVSIRFVKNRAALQFKKRYGDILGGGIAITLGEIAISESGVAAVNGRIYIARMASGEIRYVFRKVNERWKLVQKMAGMVS